MNAASLAMEVAARFAQGPLEVGREVFHDARLRARQTADGLGARQQFKRHFFAEVALVSFEELGDHHAQFVEQGVDMRRFRGKARDVIRLGDPNAGFLVPTGENERWPRGVEPLPNPLPTPEVVAPIRPGAGFVTVKKALPGALVQLMVNNLARSPGVEVWSDPASVWVPPPSLADQQSVLAVQFLCDKSSVREGRGTTVTRGQLKVDVAPGTVTRGATSQVTVTAKDADTGAPVNAQILLNGAPVGWSGQPFAYAPKLGDPPPAGVAREPVGYFDRTFSIALSDPMWTLTLGVSPPVLFFHALKITIDKVTFVVTPDWNPALAKTLVGQASGTTPSLAASTLLPVPTGSVKTVSVAMTYQWSTPGGAVDEYHTADAASGAEAAAVKVAYANKDHSVGWLLHVVYLYDPQESEGVYRPAILMNQVN